MHIKILHNLQWYVPLFLNVFITFHLCCTTKLVAATQEFVVANGKLTPSTLPQIHVYTKSKIACAAHCSFSDVCRIASYDSAAHVCVTDPETTCKMETVNSSSAVLMKIPTVHVVCGTKWYPFNGRCYYFEKNIKAWQDAQDDCQLRGSDLVKIEDSCEQKWLATFLTDNAFENTWIGGTDMAVQEQWVWISDQTFLSYTNWDIDDGEPDNTGGRENCAVLKKSVSYKWYDRNTVTFVKK